MTSTQQGVGAPPGRWRTRTGGLRPQGKGGHRPVEGDSRMTVGAPGAPSGGSSQPFTPAPVLRPRQQVENQLRSAILSGTFGRGDRLPTETHLAEQLRVSRATIREALRSLTQAGLIRKESGAKGGSFVEDYDHHTLGNLLVERLSNTLELGSITYAEVGAFRNILEVPTVRLAAEHRDEMHLSALRDVVEHEKRATVTDPAISDYNREFHTILADASGNRLLAAFVAALHRVAHPLEFIETSPEVGRRAVIHHIDIVAAVAAQDADAAAEAMHNHLDYLRDHAKTGQGI
jgi:GntR family transcriptional regulator, transcriptional repressor for pyruvate dehydrogenase complex